jgi:hypothetical protein
MNATDVIAALEFPSTCRIDQRLSKKLLIEKMTPTAGDKKRINDGIDSLIWLAALKPTTTGIAEHRDDTRSYLEIAILALTARPKAKTPRLIELIHRAIPHPTLLLTEQGETVTLSLAHIRPHQGHAGKTVLDNLPLTARLDDLAAPINQDFRAAMALSRQPSQTLLALYQGWIDTVIALQAAALTGQFRPNAQPSASRAEALARIRQLEKRTAELRKAATREKILARQIDLNLDIKRMQAEIAAAQDQL